MTPSGGGGSRRRRGREREGERVAAGGSIRRAQRGLRDSEWGRQSDDA